MRTDARRNRDQILAAAKVILSEQGPDVPMEEFARRAGVGVGTLYRRFPDREALIRAVVIDSLTEIHTEMTRIATAGLTAWDALTEILQVSVNIRPVLLSPTIRNMFDDDPDIGELRLRTLEVIDDLVRAAQRAGDVRTDIGTGDLIICWASVCHGTAHLVDEQAVDPRRRCLSLLLDGMRAGQPGTLPGTPISTTDIIRLRPGRTSA